jgi:hypothetical protein
MAAETTATVDQNEQRDRPQDGQNGQQCPLKYRPPIVLALLGKGSSGSCGHLLSPSGHRAVVSAERGPKVHRL